MRAKLSVVIATVCASLVWVASASAAITSSNVTVTSPTGTYLLNDDVAGGTTITGSGVSQGGNAGDTVDINCYQGSSVLPLTSTMLAAGGSFAFSAPLHSVNGHTCVLRAVPNSDSTPYSPGGDWSYTGPTIAIDERSENLVSGGPNNGDLGDYELFDSQLQGGFEYGSLGDCAIDASFAYDPVTLAPSQLDHCDAYFDWTNANGSLGTRSELQVDGADAYLPGNIESIPHLAPSTIPGFPSLAYSYSLDPATGDVTIDETDELVRCSPGTAPEYPPSSSNCTRLVPTGVQATEHVTQYDGGLVTTVLQRFSSTDGQSHSLNVLGDNGFADPQDDGQLDFPWSGTGMQEYPSGAVVRGPSAGGSGSFYVNGSGSTAAPQGSVTFSDPPSSVNFVTGTSAPDSRLELSYGRTIPPTGSVPLGFTYADAFSPTQVYGYAAAAQAAFTPIVAISSPGVGAHTSKASVTVSGSASDVTGLSAVTVDGHVVAVAANGAWKASVSLRPGANTISATAINAFGNSATARRVVSLNSASLAPRVSHLSQTHALWREQGGAARHLPPVGTTFAFTLNKGAWITLEFAQPRTGRRLRNRCMAVGPGNRRGRPCTLTVAVATMSLQGHAGRNKVRFSGLVDGRELDPGRYTLVIVAAHGDLVSAPRQISFTIAS